MSAEFLSDRYSDARVHVTIPPLNVLLLQSMPFQEIDPNVSASVQTATVPGSCIPSPIGLFHIILILKPQSNVFY